MEFITFHTECEAHSHAICYDAEARFPGLVTPGPGADSSSSSSRLTAPSAAGTTEQQRHHQHERASSSNAGACSQYPQQAHESGPGQMMVPPVQCFGESCDRLNREGCVVTHLSTEYGYTFNPGCD